MTDELISQLVDYALLHGLIEPEDRIWAINAVSGVLGLDSYTEPEQPCPSLPLEEILRGLLDASKIRKRALYAITDKRLLILTDSAKSVEYSAISAAKLDRDEDGHTSLLCGEDAIKAKPWKRRAAMLSGAITDDNTGMCERFVMYALPDADKVKETLKPFLPL